jgi:hypothetical protein
VVDLISRTNAVASYAQVNGEISQDSNVLAGLGSRTVWTANLTPALANGVIQLNSKYE